MVGWYNRHVAFYVKMYSRTVYIEAKRNVYYRLLRLTVSQNPE